MIQIANENIFTGEKQYTQQTSIVSTDPLTGGVDTNIFEYNSINYQNMSRFFNFITVSSFSHNIGFSNPSMWGTSSSTIAITGSNSALTVTTTAVGAGLSYQLVYSDIKLLKNNSYTISFDAVVNGAQKTLSGNTGLQIRNGYNSYGATFGASANIIITSGGLNYVSTTFSPTADSYYRFLIGGPTAINGSVTFNNISINILNSSASLLNDNGFSPLQLPVVSFSRNLFKDKMLNTNFSILNTNYNSNSVSVTSVSATNNLIFNTTRNLFSGYLLSDYGLIVLTQNAASATNGIGLNRNYYSQLNFAPTNNQGLCASLTSVTLSSLQTNYTMFIKIPVIADYSNFPTNPSNTQINGDQYKQFAYTTGFKLYDENLKEIARGKISKPIKKSSNVNVTLTPRFEN